MPAKINILNSAYPGSPDVQILLELPKIPAELHLYASQVDRKSVERLLALVNCRNQDNIEEGMKYVHLFQFIWNRLTAADGHLA